MKPAGLFAFVVFFAAVVALLGGLRRLSRRAEIESADEALRHEFDAIKRGASSRDRLQEGD